jgi:hypothetical protein
MVENKTVTQVGTRRENLKTGSKLQNADARSSIGVVVSTKFQKHWSLAAFQNSLPAVKRRAAVVAVMARNIVPIPDRGNGHRCARGITDDRGGELNRVAKHLPPPSDFAAISLRAASQSSRSTGAFNVKNDNRVSGMFHACVAGIAGACNSVARKRGRIAQHCRDFLFDEARSRVWAGGASRRNFKIE